MRYEGSPILPMGKMNLETGESKYFNVYETWSGDDTTGEIYIKDNGNFLVVFTAGNQPISKFGSFETFQHDQTRRPMFKGEPIQMVDYQLLKDLKKSKYLEGKKSVFVYTYK